MVTSSKLYVFIVHQNNLKKVEKTAFTWDDPLNLTSHWSIELNVSVYA